MNVAYLGPKGTFSEEAALRYFPPNGVELIMHDSIFDVIEAVAQGEMDKGIVPIENAIEGTITLTTDGLVTNNVWIEGEAILPVALHLLTVEGADVDDIREVWSIAPALAQCRNFIRKMNAKIKHYSSTANAAASLVKADDKHAGAIASEWAAKTFGLEIAKKNVHDFEGNSTRFIIISKEHTEVPEATKSMLLITPMQDRPGLLAIILNVFSSLDINLSWIESRPTKKKLGTYRFFVEAQLGAHEINLQKAISILKTYGHDVRVLGSFNSKQL
ncbi:prephenate dehydratase [Siminovitchia sp. FSL H7-0308]|uniref:Prephenate dehydratase n=1 Tax=Siminovitchia thermophila TaxID=1245522 RepID=A0ABS2RCN1_9BACI|nr:prephenate dehydratase [Siminovitchia thermophila]MBM7717430.1 prephenate dehydratase [Siminovitchia thermophila]ONK22138.1 prephenate dehydratase [Bacillus sp. VT-16-64]